MFICVVVVVATQKLLRTTSKLLAPPTIEKICGFSAFVIFFSGVFQRDIRDHDIGEFFLGGFFWFCLVWFLHSFLSSSGCQLWTGKYVVWLEYDGNSSLVIFRRF